jgi:electron transport complex protein RnfB
MVETLTLALDALLPQTQCTRCGYPGCLPYAGAMARDEADINRCAPGGTRTIAELAALLGRDALPLDPSVGEQAAPQVAVIDESRCIGCARCLPACPVDAIVGAQRLMHTVIAAQCTGCDLCRAPCPVDCIELRPVADDAVEPGNDRPFSRQRAADARRRFEGHTQRLLAAAAAQRHAFDAARALPSAGDRQP